MEKTLLQQIVGLFSRRLKSCGKVSLSEYLLKLNNIIRKRSSILLFFY